jgi:hypothetical protein
LVLGLTGRSGPVFKTLERKEMDTRKNQKWDQKTKGRQANLDFILTLCRDVLDFNCHVVSCVWRICTMFLVFQLSHVSWCIYRSNHSIIDGLQASAAALERSFFYVNSHVDEYALSFFLWYGVRTSIPCIYNVRSY